MIVWRKSSRSMTSGATDCVELADLGSKVGIRDSKDPNGAQLQLHRGDLRKLVSAGKAGQARPVIFPGSRKRRSSW